MPNQHKSLYHIDVAGPNVYFVSVVSVNLPNGLLEMYVAADFVGAAIKKVQRLVASQHTFRPSRSNCVLKLRRFRLGDYVDSPQGLLSAWETAQALGELDIQAALCRRPKEVADLLSLYQPSHDDVWQRLADAMEDVSHG